MDVQSKEEGPAEPASVVPVDDLTLVASSHQPFDAFEAHFFAEGDHPDFAQRQDGFDEPEKWYRLSYRSLAAISIASSAVAIAACLALFRANAPASTTVTARLSKPAAPSAAVAKEHSAPHEPSPAPAAVLLAGPAPAPTAAAPIVHTPATAPAETPILAAATSAAAAAAPAPTLAGPAEVAKAQQPQAAILPVAAASNSDHNARELCQQAIHARRAKDILASCTAQFEADATDGAAAVAVARVEFDRGRFTQAYTWSKRAIAASPESADAYVFVGGAEQNQGHGRAAKEAYLHYLKLAPSGNYAAELRSIVKSL
jgi:tetratricopeptide (TPR) repeat protein